MVRSRYLTSRENKPFATTSELKNFGIKQFLDSNDDKTRRRPNQFPRNISEKAFLMFEYSQPNNEIKKLYVPILENPDIRESQSSNLASYDLIGRNNTLVSYQSSDSRKISISFNITAQNVDNILSGGDDDSGMHGRFKNDEKTLHSIIEKWLNCIKSSTKNNSENPSFGPPIIRLNYLNLYKNVPCVARSFTINHDRENGYHHTEQTGNLLGRYIGNTVKDKLKDTINILPNIITVSLDLQEVRVGNFGTFKPGQVIKGDNNTGWEAILTPRGTMDPDNYGS